MAVETIVSAVQFKKERDVKVEIKKPAQKQNYPSTGPSQSSDKPSCKYCKAVGHLVKNCKKIKEKERKK